MPAQSQRFMGPVTVAAASGGFDFPTGVGPDTVESLAFGMELKFMVLGMPRDCMSELQLTSRDQPQRQTYAVIAHVVDSRNRSSTNINNITGSKGAFPQNTVLYPRAISRDEISAAGRQEREYWSTHWIVKKANSVEHTKTDPHPDVRRTNGVVVPVEVNSPKLLWTDPYALFLVQEVVSRVGTLPATVNHTCDFHVHIGRYDGMAFSLPTLKKLATVLWLAEPIIRSVRNPMSPNFSNEYTWGFEQRRYSRLALALDRHTVSANDAGIADVILRSIRLSREGWEDHDSDWQQHMAGVGVAALRNEALRAIWSAKSPRELGLLLSGTQRKYRRLGFNFSAFGEEDERARTNPRTVEFRILEGTLQADLILGWLQICVKLVVLGTKGNATLFRSIVRYLLAQQHIYDDLRALDYRAGSMDSWHMSMHPERVSGCARPSRDVLFGDLMSRIGVDVMAYGPFQEKMRREYGAS